MTETKESGKPGVAIGRRKSATARVRLVPGAGKLQVNKISGIDYFQNSTESVEACRLPLHIFDLANTYDVEVQTFGGGLEGQIQAIKLGIARALAKYDIAKRPKLKSLGLLQRDSRVKERKKYGLKKARKASQYSKR